MLPKIPLGENIESMLDFLTEHLSFLTKAFSSGVASGIDAIESFLLIFHPSILIVLLTALIWFLSSFRNKNYLKKSTIRFTLLSFLGLLFIWDLGLWEPMVSTLTLVLVSTFFSVIVGVPIGIAAALYKKFYRIIIPVLDFMQTMPAFVYLIPAIPFFGLGKVSAIFATMIFAMPPAIRLTCLGIKQIPADLIEASDAFGATAKQKLFKVQLPLALPTIMAGVNQTIMLSLSMVVIAAMIGAGGLGGEVWRAIQRMKSGMGFEAGIAVVIVAMILDRVTQKITGKEKSFK